MPRLLTVCRNLASQASGQARVKFQCKSHYLGKYGSDESKEAYTEFIARLTKPPEQGTVMVAAAGAWHDAV